MGGQVLEEWQLDDCSRPEDQGRLAIPYHLDRSSLFYKFDEDSGADFGCIFLRPYYRDLMINNGIRPFPDPWRRDYRADHLKYFLVGVPTETVTIIDNLRPTTITYTSYLIGIERLQKQVGSLVDGEWFYASLPQSDVQQPICSIEGMSGGPIFGFMMNEQGELRYYAIAIQSSWDPRIRAIRACPVSFFTLQLQTWIRGVMEYR